MTSDPSGPERPEHSSESSDPAAGRATPARPGWDRVDTHREVPVRRRDRSSRSGRPRRAQRRDGLAGLLRETAIIVVSALVLSLVIKTFLIQAFFIPSGSMQDTLAVGDRVLVTKLVPAPFDVHRGDIVVFKDPGGWLPPPQPQERSALRRGLDSALTFVGLLPYDSGEHLIKRVIGVPGDTVECCDDQGRVSVNGTGIDEPYLAPGSVPSELEFRITVPDSALWVMGDNRQNSQDSRYQQGRPGGGTVAMSDVVGVAFVTVWPASRWGVLRNPGSTFADVPDADPTAAPDSRTTTLPGAVRAVGPAEP